MEQSKQSFHVSDPELAFVAANAAIEIDDLINGETSGLENVSILSEKLKNTLGKGGGSDTGVRSFIDPISTDVFSKAFATSHNFNIGSNDVLYQKIEELADELSSLESSDESLPVIIREFCVALSKYSLAIENSHDERRVKYPYRK